MDRETLVAGIRAGKKRAVARMISMVEDGERLAADVLHELHAEIGGAHVIGITGSPGTGKSTLTDRLLDHYLKQGLQVGVIAVDPSSPFSGGAILGDRIRMQHKSTHPKVFIRSMGTRGHLGGLGSHTADAVKVLDAAGCDVVIVETVGVGQAEVEVIKLADTVALVLVPGLGDDVQAVKAGVMEIADVFVVNKSDIDGADKVHAEVEAAMGLGHPDEDEFWWPPIVRTSAERGSGLDALAAALEEHKQWSQAHGTWHVRRQRRLQEQVRALLTEAVVSFVFDTQARPRPGFEALFEAAREGERSPQSVADELLAAFKAS